MDKDISANRDFSEMYVGDARLMDKEELKRVLQGIIAGED
jgi:hypothetical protein